jgi:hypothetical protein
MKFLLFSFLFLISTNSFGNCVCRCVNGEMTPLCSNSLDLPPICPPTICPIVPPSIQPISPLYIPPIGTSQCQNKQILNQRTGQYEWRLICQ